MKNTLFLLIVHLVVIDLSGTIMAGKKVNIYMNCFLDQNPKNSWLFYVLIVRNVLFWNGNV